jgi:hypothetical protein
MANPELVRVMDYILNRCDRKSIEAVAAAVVRRRREQELFADSFPDAKQMARDAYTQINAGASIEGMRETVRNMAVRIIRQEAPELTEEQIAELTAAWIPGGQSGESAGGIPGEYRRYHFLLIGCQVSRRRLIRQSVPHLAPALPDV